MVLYLQVPQAYRPQLMSWTLVGNFSVESALDGMHHSTVLDGQAAQAVSASLLLALP